MSLLNTIEQIQERTDGLQRAINELLSVTRELSPKQMVCLPLNNRGLETSLQEIRTVEIRILNARNAAHTVRRCVNTDGTYVVRG